MRIAAVVAVVFVAAGCSSAQPAPSTSVSSQPPPGAASAQAADTSSVAPARGTPLDQVIAWIQAGTAVDVSRYQYATATDGAVTHLPSDITFVTPSGKTACATELRYGDTDLECVANLKNPPPRPPSGEHIDFDGDWIEYQGAGATVGSFHGDPGPFAPGRGPRLPYGSRITFRGYDCRMDQTGLYCANAEAQSAVKISDSGLIPFGCLQQNPDAAKDGVGELFRC